MGIVSNRIEKKIVEYSRENFGGVLHTTLNPKGPGVVRIHMIPPVPGETGPGVAILNGQDIIPVNTSWTILLCEFIKEVNKYAGKPLTQQDVDAVEEATCRSVRKVFPLISKKQLKEDIYTIMNSFRQIAQGELPDESVGFLSLGEYAPYMRAPHRMDLMVSAMTRDGAWHCNQKCVHCYAAGQTSSDEPELSAEDWKKILDKLREIGVPQVTFTGGEPTMREDLFELIDHAQWFVTRLNTNGIKLTPEYCASLYKASLDSMQITFYSDDPSVHNRLVGAERYDDTVRGIDNALNAGLNISVNTPLCTLNGDYKKTLEFLKSRGVIYVTCSGLITTGNAGTGASERMQLSVPEVKKVLRESVEYAYSNGMEISFTSPGWIDEEFCCELGITMPSCGAGLSNMAITPGGNVVPCQSWLSGKPLGNMLADRWEDIWNSEECRKRREFSALMTGTCPLRKKEGADEANC